MKPVYEKVDYSENSSIKGFEINSPILSCPLHLHPEVELVYIKKSFGKRFIGNSLNDFSDNDLVLIGSSVPHFWKNDELFYEQQKPNASQAMVIQFLPEIFSENLLSKSEFNNISNILEKAKSGLLIEDKKKRIPKLMKKIINNEGIKKLIYLVEILDMIGKNENYKYINISNKFEDSFRFNRIRFMKLNSFIEKNFSNKITLSDAAKIANMNESAFCRYFKKETGQTFIQFVNELRINSALGLLKDNSLNISQICFEVGYNNLSNFNRQFKRIVGKSPTEYLSQFSN